jgi:hypothetical protein
MRSRLCRSFRNLSAYIWDLFIDSAYNGFYQTSNTNIRRGIGLSENTITELLLLKISKYQPHDFITVKICSSSYESKVGADWEWWFLSRSGCIGLRIQAKRLFYNNSDYEYSHLDHKTNSVYQVDTLINNAKCLRIAPLYAFYNYWQDDFLYNLHLNPALAGIRCCRIRTCKNLGISIAPAYKIRNLIKNINTKKLVDVLPISWPIYSLTCCNFSDLSTSILNLFKNYISQDDLEIEIHKKLPQEIYNRFKGEKDETTPDYMTFMVDLENPSEEWYNIRDMVKKYQHFKE